MSKNLKVRQVEAFRAVMQLGSMTLASDQLGVSQPAISRLISDFQEAVGYKLFTRRRHGILPTEDAWRLYQEVESVFTGLDELSRRAAAIKNLEIGHISVSAVSVTGNNLLPLVIADFVKKYEGVNIRLDICRHDRGLEALFARRSDLGLISGSDFTGDLSRTILSTRPAVCIMPQGHFLADRPVIRAEDLAGLPFISFPHDASYRYRTDSLFERAGVERDLRLEGGTHESVCNLVAAGLGVSIISPFTAALRSRLPVVARPFLPALNLQIGILWDDARLSSAARLFRDFVVEWFKANDDAISTLNPHSQLASAAIGLRRQASAS